VGADLAVRLIYSASALPLGLHSVRYTASTASRNRGRSVRRLLPAASGWSIGTCPWSRSC